VTINMSPYVLRTDMHKAGKLSDTSLEVAVSNAALRVLKLGNPRRHPGSRI
jgi:hypothetical protein